MPCTPYLYVPPLSIEGCQGASGLPHPRFGLVLVEPNRKYMSPESTIPGS